jgi:mono/diheme cytochrome c family protein
MLAFSQLSDAGTAAMINYERSWGNHASMVTPDDVKRAWARLAFS